MGSQNYLKTLIICIVAITFLFACSSDKEETTTPDNEKKQEEPTVSEQKTNETEDNLEEEPTQSEADLLEIAPKPPTNLDELLAYPVGPLAGNGKNKGTKNSKMSVDEMAEYVKSVLPPVKEDADETFINKWSHAFYYLFSEDYPNPNDIVKKVRLDNFGNPSIEDERFHFKEQMNVLVILDVSGSMANEINGKTMMNIAKDSINKFVSDLPEDVNIGLRVYGHEGKRTGKTKEESCQSTELVYDIQPLNKQEFKKVIEPFEPTGWTPIGLSLEKVKEDFADFSNEESTNLVYVVSDGVETCGGDPVKAAQELVDSDIRPIINVIGFNVNIDGQNHLRKIAEAGGGIYTNAGDEEQLQEAFDQAEKMINHWQAWRKGTKEDVVEESNEQLRLISQWSTEWLELQDDERWTKVDVISHLKQEHYINSNVEEAIKIQSREHQDLFGVGFAKDMELQLRDEVAKQREKLMKEIDKEFKKGTGK